MKTVDDVRKELREVKEYYVNIQNLERASNIIGTPTALKLVEKYNRLIKNAPVKLINLYICLYLDNNSQETVSFDWNCSLGYIKTLNRRLYEFYVKEFAKEDKS